MWIFGWILLALPPIIAEFSPEGLDYILRTIDFETNIHSGVFSCISWDISQPPEPFDDTLNAILSSNRLANTVQYVLHGTKFKDQELLPTNPTLLIMHAGNNVSFLEQNETKQEIFDILDMFDLSTKLLVLVNHTNTLVINEILQQIYFIKFTSSVFYDSVTTRAFRCNGETCWDFSKALPSIYIFTFGRLWYNSLPITYIINENIVPFDWNQLWLKETAKYMNTEAIEYQHNCQRLTGSAFNQCLKECKGNQSPADICFVYTILNSGLSKDIADLLFTTTPLHMKIAVPKDRPLNVAELLVMPFSWQVWILLVLIFVSSELIKHRFPQLFTNDPTLLAVCGFERHDLNQAGQLEKVIFLSLITLMFFMTNAFETKIVSLMISTPPVQSIQTLEDLTNSDLKFRADLESNPHFANHSVIGNILEQGESPWFSETMPGVAMLWYSDFAEVRMEVSFDFERMQPFYVLLDYEFIVGPEAYPIWKRDLFAEAFRTMHIKLVESGAFKWFKTGWKYFMRYKHLGRRPRKVIENKVELDFRDMQPAWMVLAVGLIISTLGFVGEQAKTYIGKRKKMQERQWITV